MPRDSAQSSTPPTSAPDCDRKASLPGFGFAMPKLALTPSAGTQMPRQFGPMMRRQVGRAASSILWRSSRPSPAVTTTAARVPFLPSAAIRPGTRVWRRGDDREVRHLGQFVDAEERLVPGDLPMLGIDEIDRPRKAAIEHIFGELRADRAAVIARPDHRDRAWAKRVLKVPDCHVRPRVRPAWQRSYGTG